MLHAQDKIALDAECNHTYSDILIRFPHTGTPDIKSCNEHALGVPRFLIRITTDIML